MAKKIEHAFVLMRQMLILLVYNLTSGVHAKLVAPTRPRTKHVSDSRIVPKNNI